jgi:hypothetical protein
VVHLAVAVVAIWEAEAAMVAAEDIKIQIN